MIWNAFVLALRELRRNILRSFLTILGIVIGVGAVIVMVTHEPDMAAYATRVVRFVDGRVESDERNDKRAA